MKKHFVVGALATMVSIVALNAALANTVLGTGYVTTTTNAQNATPTTVAGLPGSAPFVTFSINSNPLSMNDGGGYTLGAFIASGGGTPITYANGATSGTSLGGTLWDFVGSVTVTTGEKFQAGHDDGVTLVIGGLTVINVPGPSGFALTTSTYTGPSGNQPFQLVYGECCSPPAVLQIDLPLTSGVPEPSTWAMMVLGFAGLGFAGYRRATKARTTVAAT
jgi:hypothetical protein